MGAAVSTGANNDELIDNLKEAEYIKSQQVEQVFRIVDRAHYYLTECRESAYKDLAWKSGTLHLSAPCIYSEVMEALQLEKGMSFLNLGSGTGYLNTMVGYVIGPYGVNHGIELHHDNVKYAEEKLEKFKKICAKFDDLEFGEPVFVTGNCLNLAPENRLYDRVYCGAACPQELTSRIQNMIKVNGTLVMPVEDQLMKIKRVSETEFEADSVLPVSFASLVQPVQTREPGELLMLPEVHPMSLQCICRISIREAIRNTFHFETPSPRESSSHRPPAKPEPFKGMRFSRREGGRYPLNILPTAQGLMIMGAFDHSDDDEDDDVDGVSDEGDDDLLDLQLRQHALERRRKEVRSKNENGKQKPEDIDSELSDGEAEICGKFNGGRIKGTRSPPPVPSSAGENDSELMESEDGIVADDEDDGFNDDETVEDREKMSGKKESSVLLSKGGEKEIKAQEQQAANGRHNGQCHHKDTLPCSDPDVPEIVENFFRSRSTKFIMRNISSSSEDDVLDFKEVGSRSSAIQVNSTVMSSNPRPMKMSYSTSAETSGFGSLGDDILPLGSHSSVLGSLKDENDEEMMTGEEFITASSSEMGKNSPGSPKDTDFSLEGGTADGEDDKWTDSDDDEGNLKNEKPIKESGSLQKHHDKSRDDSSSCHKMSSEENDSSEEDSDELQEPIRGPNFTLFLREKVESLPIPSTLKAFILHYR